MRDNDIHESTVHSLYVVSASTLFIISEENCYCCIYSIKMNDPEIDLKVYESNVSVGGSGGVPYTFQDKNALLSILVVHRDDDYIRGLTMELSNGQTESVGELIDRNPVILNFHDCQIKNIVMYYRESSQWKTPIVNGMEFNTSKGDRTAYCKSFSQTKQQSLPVGSGWCAGVFGGAGNALDSVGLAMLKVPPS